jgi:hypothetical protein
MGSSDALINENENGPDSPVIPRLPRARPKTALDKNDTSGSQTRAREQLAKQFDAKPMLEAEAKKNQQAAGKTTGLANGPNASVKNDKSIPKPIDSRKEVAKQFNVSQGYVHAAEKIKETDETVFQEVKAGTTSIPEAKRKLDIKDRPLRHIELVGDFFSGVDRLFNVRFVIFDKGLGTPAEPLVLLRLCLIRRLRVDCLLCLRTLRERPWYRCVGLAHRMALLFVFRSTGNSSDVIFPSPSAFNVAAMDSRSAPADGNVRNPGAPSP